MRSFKLEFNQLNLSATVLDGVRKAGYKEPTPIQEQCIPLAISGRDVLGLAQTGTGKTAAFVLPLLNSLEKKATTSDRPIKALVVAPTRELADQINQAIIDLGYKTNLKSLALYGGVNKSPQDKSLKRGIDIAVACPGRLLDHVSEGTINLNHVETLVLDEADTMCDMGFLPDIKRILKHLPKRKQTLFFAATMPDDIRELTSSILKDPETVQIGTIAPVHTVSHTLYPTTDKLKKNMLLHLLRETATGQVLVFTRTKRRARFLAADLEKSKYSVAPLQGNMSQNKRRRAIDGFRKGEYDLLVATDIASRGIDVTEITHVINFDMPNTVDTYIHRIGRTGRAESNGEAFTLSVPDDELLIRKVEKILGGQIERRQLDDFDYGGFSPNLVGGPTDTRTNRSPRTNGSARTNRSPRTNGSARTNRSPRTSRSPRTMDRTRNSDRQEGNRSSAREFSPRNNKHRGEQQSFSKKPVSDRFNSLSDSGLKTEEPRKRKRFMGFQGSKTQKSGPPSDIPFDQEESTDPKLPSGQNSRSKTGRPRYFHKRRRHSK